jgi:hypothetical protein
MEDLTVLLEDFTWENYKDISDAIVKFDEFSIDNEMFRQASVYSYYYGLMGAAKKRMNDLDTELVRLQSTLRRDYKENSTAKLTAKDLDDLVFANESYIEAVGLCNEASFKYELLKGLVRALEQKKDMIQQVSANKREETKLYK